MNKGRKISGGKYRKFRKKKLSEIRKQPRNVMLGKLKRKQIRTRGGAIKSVLFFSDTANVLDPKTHKAKVSKILSVLEVPSNKLLKDVLRKGTIIETEQGKAKITNRPSQEGSVQAVIVQ